MQQKREKQKSMKQKWTNNREKSMEPKAFFFLKTNTIDKPLARQIRNKRVDTNYEYHQ